MRNIISNQQKKSQVDPTPRSFPFWISALWFSCYYWLWLWLLWLSVTCWFFLTGDSLSENRPRPGSPKWDPQMTQKSSKWHLSLQKRVSYWISKNSDMLRFTKDENACQKIHQNYNSPCWHDFQSPSNSFLRYFFETFIISIVATHPSKRFNLWKWKRYFILALFDTCCNAEKNTKTPQCSNSWGGIKKTCHMIIHLQTM